MLIVYFAQWWFTTGWRQVLVGALHRAQASLEFFSVLQLAGSLFAPYRQISAEQAAHGSLTAQLHILGDKLFSRFMGMIIRSVIILIGLGAAVITLFIGLIAVLLWPFVPLAPVIGLIMTIMGVYI